MKTLLRFALLAASAVFISCEQENQYFAWGKFSQLFAPKGGANLNEIEKKVADLERKLDFTIEKQEKMLNVTCPIHYKGKCFRMVTQSGTQTDRNEAIALCQNIGWKLANVYSRDHFKLLESYLRRNLGTQSYIKLWLMMSWNVSLKTVVMPDGTRPPTDVPWVNGYPKTSSSYGFIYLQINRNPAYQYNGLVNYSWNSNLHGGLCETELKF